MINLFCSGKKPVKVLLVICMMMTVLGICARPIRSQAATTSSVYNAVKGAYGDEFPLSSSNMITVNRTNVFGTYSKVLGVSAKYFSTYTAAKKSNSTEEYMCFVCKAVSKKAVKKIKNSLKSYIVNEYNSNLNYHSELGNNLLKDARVGSKGKYVYLFVLDTEGNATAIEAFKEALA